MLYIVSDRKHCRIAMYNLLGRGPGEDDVFVWKKLFANDIAKIQEGDVVCGNMPLEAIPLIQARGATVLVFEADIKFGFHESADFVNRSIDETGILVSYTIERDVEAEVPTEGLVHVNEEMRRAAVFSYLREHGIAHRAGMWTRAGTASRAVRESGKAVVGAGTMPRWAAEYGEAHIPFFLLEGDYGEERLVRYWVIGRTIVHRPLSGKPVTKGGAPVSGD